MLPVLPALRELLPRGGLARGSVVTVAEFGLLALALAAGASADGAWCGIAGVPEAGVLAAAGLGLDTERTLLVPDPGHAWPQVVASLLDGCELVLLRPPVPVPPPGAPRVPGASGTPGVPGAQIRQRLEATLRRGRGVLLVVGDWPGAQVRLRVLTQGWTGLGDGYGRLRACCAQVMADGRGQAAVARTRWLWLPAEDGRVTAADPADIPSGGAGGYGERAALRGGKVWGGRLPEQAQRAVPEGRLPEQAQRAVPEGRLPEQAQRAVPEGRLPEQAQRAVPEGRLPEQAQRAVPEGRLPEQAQRAVPEGRPPGLALAVSG
jgi:hypothetical protein